MSDKIKLEDARFADTFDKMMTRAYAMDVHNTAGVMRFVQESIVDVFDLDDRSTRDAFVVGLLGYGVAFRQLYKNTHLNLSSHNEDGTNKTSRDL